MNVFAVFTHFLQFFLTLYTYLRDDFYLQIQHEEIFSATIIQALCDTQLLDIYMHAHGSSKPCVCAEAANHKPAVHTGKPTRERGKTTKERGRTTKERGNHKEQTQQHSILVI